MLGLLNACTAKEGIFHSRYVYFDGNALVSVGQALLAFLSCFALCFGFTRLPLTNGVIKSNILASEDTHGSLITIDARIHQWKEPKLKAKLQSM